MPVSEDGAATVDLSNGEACRLAALLDGGLDGDPGTIRRGAASV